MDDAQRGRARVTARTSSTISYLGYCAALSRGTLRAPLLRAAHGARALSPKHFVGYRCFARVLRAAPYARDVARARGLLLAHPSPYNGVSHSLHLLISARRISAQKRHAPRAARVAHARCARLAHFRICGMRISLSVSRQSVFKFISCSRTPTTTYARIPLCACALPRLSPTVEKFWTKTFHAYK